MPGVSDGHTPARITGLRRRETDRIIHLLNRGHRLISITGLGGIGKSTLALDVVDALRRERPEFACWVLTVGPSDSVGISERLLDELDGAPDDTDREPGASLNTSGPRLIVIDGGEHLVNDADALEAVIESTEDLYVLVTTRVALGSRSEVTVPLRGLDTTPDGDAMKMFLSIAEDHSVKVAKADRPRAREIVARLGGYPLAIRLCAAELQTRTVTAIHEQMIARHEPETVGVRTDPDLREMIEWTLERQSPQAVKLVRVLTVFHGWCTIDSIEGIAAEVDRRSNGQHRRIAGRTLWLAELVDSGLVDVEPSGGSADNTRLYRVHDSVSEVVQAYAVPGEVPISAVRIAHREWFTSRAAELAAASTTRRESSAFERLQTELPEYLAALDAEIRYNPGSALRVLNRLGDFWISRGRIRSGARLLRNALRQLGEDESGLGAREPDAMLAQSWLSYMSLRVGVLANTIDYQNWLAEQLDDAPGESLEPTPEHFALAVHFVFVAMVNNRYDAALRVAERYRDLAIEFGDDYHAGVFCFYLARASEQSGEVVAAAEHIEQAIVHVQRTENDSFLARCLSVAAVLKRDTLSPDELIDELKRVTEIHLKNRSFKDAALISAPLAIAYFQSGNPSEALALLRQTLALSQRIHFFDGQLYSVVLIAFSDLSENSTPHNLERCARLYGGLRPYLKHFNAVTAPGYQQMLHGAIQGLRLVLGQGALDRITAQSPTAWSQLIAEADAFAAEQQQSAPEQVTESAASIEARVNAAVAGLNTRERELLELVLTGITDKQVADRMRLKPNTVRSYNSRIFRKFNVASRTELLALFRGRDL